MQNNLLMKIIAGLVITFVLISCAPKTTNTTILTSTHIPPTITSTLYPERDTIYFWWYENFKSQLWEITQEGDSMILYELPSPQTIDEAVDTGVLTENGAETLRKLATTDPNVQKSEEGEIKIQSLSGSLQISPDRLRLAWYENVSYCSWFSDISYCVGETIIKIFNVETKKVEFSHVIPIEQEVFFTPIWSPDSKKLAYHTRQETKNIIHVLDINSAQIMNFEGSGEFTWTPNSNQIIFSDTNGLYIFNLDKQENKHILDGNWRIFDLTMSLDGNFVVFTGIKDFDDPTTPYIADFIHPSYQFIYTYNLKTSVLNPVINENKRDWILNLQWLPDGKHIIYTQEEPYTAPPNQVFIRNPITGETILIENIPLDVDNDWKISKDGKKLLFVGWKYGETVSFIIYDINKKEWSKVPVPTTIQTIMNENLQEGEYIQHYRLWSATW